MNEVISQRSGAADRWVTRAAERSLARDARRVLRAAGLRDVRLDLSLVDDAEIRELNRAYRGIDRPTDVLSFSLQEGDEVLGDPRALGDIVISVQTASRRRKRPLGAELAHLATHGICHLLGWDHDSYASARRMFAYQRQLLRDAGIYLD